MGWDSCAGHTQLPGDALGQALMVLMGMCGRKKAKATRLLLHPLQGPRGYTLVRLPKKADLLKMQAHSLGSGLCPWEIGGALLRDPQEGQV